MYVLVKCQTLQENQAILKMCDDLGILYQENATIAKIEGEIDNLKFEISSEKLKLKKAENELSYANSRLKRAFSEETALLKKIEFLKTRCKALKTQYRKCLTSKPSQV